MAPEVMFELAYTKKADVYSMGALLFTLFFHTTPFLSGHMKRLKADLNKGNIEIRSPGPISRNGIEFILECLQGRDVNRPNA